MQAPKNVGGISMDFSKLVEGFLRKTKYFATNDKFSKTSQNYTKKPNSMDFITNLILSYRNFSQICPVGYWKFKLATEQNLRSGNKANNL